MRLLTGLSTAERESSLALLASFYDRLTGACGSNLSSIARWLVVVTAAAAVIVFRARLFPKLAATFLGMVGVARYRCGALLLSTTAEQSDSRLNSGEDHDDATYRVRFGF